MVHDMFGAKGWRMDLFGLLVLHLLILGLAFVNYLFFR